MWTRTRLEINESRSSEEVVHQSLVLCTYFERSPWNARELDRNIRNPVETGLTNNRQSVEHTGIKSLWSGIEWSGTEWNGMEWNDFI